ncbi:alpha-galactosidase [Paenibacillus psychroresistens]|uniref:Alpha-galactosidase n=1 Tax=Paenibacillus psychroresistens TaxID=1778678 RepID=A0A6B8RNJ8_9BACL|nr:glycoside hydrolase family 36 protein [Paenibacillus psychroresistens]QGQ97599.1 alpha-galactosidase [Paenibacillus psychroresistens]
MRVAASGFYEYQLESEDSPFRASLRVERKDDGVEIIHVMIEADAPAVPPIFKLHWKHPIIDVQGLWHPTAIYNKGLRADWSTPFESKSTYSAPVACLFSAAGLNRLTFAFSDVLNLIKYDAGVNEESSTFICYVSLFDTPTTPLSHYEASLRIDTREIAYYDVLDEVSQWWCSYESNTPAEVPPSAVEPMYSTWYTFHQQLTPEGIEEQCRLAKTLGCETVIVDDGWQTSDNARGYAYCGDWLVCEAKIPDMKAHVERVHKIGMKYILWYSVPFIGRNSDSWAKYKDKLLFTMDYLETGVVDPRYPDVREYLIGTYEKALLDWNLDGFKLDFVDVFSQPDNDNAVEGDGRDYLSVAQAVDVLLSETMDRLRALKPDIMIEFRQNYISPLMRKYGNLFRAADCPNDAIQNRMRTIDIRLICGNTAAHSDMIMWNVEEPTDSAALQLINVLFSVPQISVRLDTLPESHKEMLSFWLSFWKEHRDVLLNGHLEPHHPELLYPIVIARNKDTLIAAVYHDTIVKLDGILPEKIVVVNGTRTNRVVIEALKDLGKNSVHIRDSSGKTVAKISMELKQGFHAIDVPSGGLAVLRTQK